MGDHGLCKFWALSNQISKIKISNQILEYILFTGQVIDNDNTWNILFNIFQVFSFNCNNMVKPIVSFRVMIYIPSLYSEEFPKMMDYYVYIDTIVTTPAQSEIF